MSINYKNLFKLLDKKGYSVGYLIKNGIVGDYSGRKIRKGDPVDLKYIDNICQFLRVPIEQVVEIKLDKEPDDQTNLPD